MNVQAIQSGLLKWMTTNSRKTRSMASIDNVCKKVYEQYCDPQHLKNSKYKLFYPLIKYGVVEFYGEDRFGLSSSSIVSKNDIFLFCNIPKREYVNLSKSLIYESELGIVLFKNTLEVRSFVKQIGIPESKFSLKDALMRIGSLNLIIETWKDDEIYAQEKLFFFNSITGWGLTENGQIGVYKKGAESFANRVLKVSDNSWKKIPTRAENIDAFNLAVLWAQINSNKHVGVKYSLKDELLVVDNIYFPLIISRLLFINSLFMTKGNSRSFENCYFINNDEFKVLNNLLKNKIAFI